MVRILSSAVAIAALATSGLALNLPKRDVAKVESDLASISTQVTTLDKAITALTTSSSLLDALVSMRIFASDYFLTTLMAHRLSTTTLEPWPPPSTVLPPMLRFADLCLAFAGVI